MVRITPGMAVTAGAVFLGAAGGATAAARLTGNGGNKGLEIGAGGIGLALGATALTLGKNLPGAVRGAMLAGGLGLLAAAGLDAILGNNAAKAGPAPVPKPLPTPSPAPGPSPTPTPSNPQSVLREGDMLPDGEQYQPGNVYMQGNELRFDSMVANTGTAPIQLALTTGADGTPQSTDQVLYNADGTRRQVPIRGGFELDDRGDHNHLHFNDFVYFQLYKANADGSADSRQLAAGIKQSFFITDVARATGTPQENVDKWNSWAQAAAGKEGVNHLDATTTQQINVGWADVYGAGLEGQSLDVGNLAPGTYVLRQTFDPNDEIVEADERNNSREVRIKIDANRHVTVLDSHLVDTSKYVQQADGRTVIPGIQQAMEQTTAAGGSETTVGSSGRSTSEYWPDGPAGH